MNKVAQFLRSVEPERIALTAYCRRLLWSREDLDDALQETLAVAFRAFHGPGAVRRRAWLFRIATWTCFNLNRRRRRDSLVTEPLDEADVPAALQLEREIAYEELLEDPSAVLDSFGQELAEACRRLTQKEQAILLLKSVADLSCAEIAIVLEVPLGTAQGLLTRARHKVRAELVESARSRPVSGNWSAR